MKRSLYLFPLMAMTALSLTLAACDDNKDDTASTETTAPADTAVITPPEATPEPAPSVMPAAATMIVTGAKAYATSEGSTTGAIFLTVQNPGTEADKLTGVSTTVAPTAEIHETYTDETGVTQMRKIESLDLAAGQQIELSPSANHIMLMGLTSPLMEGSTFPVTLTFEKASPITVPVVVTGAGVAPSATTEPAATEGTVTTVPPTTTTPETMGTGMDTGTTDATGGVTATDEPVTTTAPADVPATTEQPVE